MKRSLIFTAFLAAGFVCSSVVFPSAASAAISPASFAIQDDKAAEADEDIDTLTIGSKAPELDVEHWVQNGEGSFKEVTKFQEGKVYVVEFWATWCGPCIASMPHIVETQEKYKDKGVQVVSISDEDLETVEKFLDREVRGKKDMTYRDLTASYCLTTDPDGSSSEQYMQAAGQNGIPCAFIVGKTGQVEWIGHPMEMDKPLASVVEGKWDRDAFAKTFAAQQEMEVFMMKLQRTFQRDKDAGLKMLDKKIADLDDGELKNQLKSIKLRILMSTGADAKELASLALETLNAMENPTQVNDLAWTLYEMAEAGDLKDKKFLGEVAAIAEKAAGKAEEANSWMIWDTVGHLYFLAGDLDKAIAAQTKAVENENSVNEASVADFLKELREQKK